MCYWFPVVVSALEEGESMKILYKIVLFMVLCPLVSILISALGVFPAGSIPMGELPEGMKDEHGDITGDSIMNYYFVESSLSFSIPGLPEIRISWGAIIGLFTTTMVIASFVLKSTQPIAVCVMAISMVSMINMSKTWWENISSNFGGYTFPTIVFLGVILMFGLLYIFLVTLIESHTHGDVSDK